MKVSVWWIGVESRMHYTLCCHTSHYESFSTTVILNWSGSGTQNDCCSL